MKELFRQKLIKTVFIVMFATLILNLILQIKLIDHEMRDNSQYVFSQINNTLTENQSDMDYTKEDFRRRSVLSAQTAAYIIQNKPDIVYNQAELRKISQMLHIDELNIFNSKGVLYAGTTPAYIGSTFYSGKQMNFFLPMLQDKSLQLTQDVVQNTVLGKPMQYTAVWQENKSQIIEIGIEPVHVQEAVRKNQLSYIFSLLTENKGDILYAVDRHTLTILGSTQKEAVGSSAADLGIQTKDLNSSDGFHIMMHGKLYYAASSGAEYSSIILVRMVSAENMYNDISQNTLFLALYLLLISSILIVCIMRYLDRDIVRGIASVNETLHQITNGNLDANVDVHTTTEMSDLSEHINLMVKSLLCSIDKMSLILNTIRTPIAVYEYNTAMNRVRATKKLAEILALTPEENDRLMGSHMLFDQKLDEIRRGRLDTKEPIYRLSSGRYIKMESFQQGSSTLGIIIDVTHDIQEKENLKHERDTDQLTKLLNRRAFYAKMDELFTSPQKLLHAALILIDLDNLKYLNDNYGHKYGDIYIAAAASALRAQSAPNKIICRLGGDEFLLFIYGCATKEQLMQYIDELKQSRGTKCFGTDAELTLQFSIGCAFYPDDSTNYSSMTKAADMHMYEDKKQRRDAKLIKNR